MSLRGPHYIFVFSQHWDCKHKPPYWAFYTGFWGLDQVFVLTQQAFYQLSFLWGETGYNDRQDYRRKAQGWCRGIRWSGITRNEQEMSCEGRGCMIRRDGNRDGLTAGQGGDTGSKQNCLPSSLESVLVYIMHWFPVSQASYFAVCLELMGACGCKRKTCWAKSLPNRWVSSGNQGVSFNFYSHPSFTWVPVTRCKSFGRRIPQPLIRLWGGPSGLAAAASSFPGLRPLLSATPPSAWEPIPWPPVDDLWPRWSLKAQTWRLTTQNNKIYRWYLRMCPESTLHFLSAFILRFTASPVASMLQRKSSASISSTLGLIDQNSADTSCMCSFHLCHIRTWCGFLMFHRKAFLPSRDCRQDGMHVSSCTAILLSWSWCCHFQKTREKSKGKPFHNLCQSGPAWSCFSVGASLEIRKDIFIVKIIGLEAYYHRLVYRDQESNMKFTGSLPGQRTTPFF